MNIQALLKGETGERANLKAVYKWILEEMSYEDFSKFAKLNFYDHNGRYQFSYRYMGGRSHDSKKAREEYIKYLAYKLIQNIATDGVELC